MKKTAWVAGASGLVGGHLIRQLAQDPAYDKVVALVRTPCRDNWADLDKVEQWQVDYENLSALSDAERVDDLFCALGSTTRKTPDKAAYHRIDVDYPLEFARLGLKHGARRYALVSAHGASTRSLSGYFKMKGELEMSLKTLGYPHLIIARPGLLKGQRNESRPGERMAEVFASFLPGNFKAIAAADVAAALIQACNSGELTNSCVQLLCSAEMQGCAQQAVKRQGDTINAK